MLDRAYPVPMKNQYFDSDSEDGLIVTFSDGTITGYVAEELPELRPKREYINLERQTSKAIGHASVRGESQKIRLIC